ncbi:sulfotransferase domain-containing protein [Streptomyces fuscichromogenes]|nr:sulfotransferase domain-containing protein [Streptomyces fuscichromogenes]
MISQPSRRYATLEFDSGRWIDFPLREGDIIISTPPKTGTTWVQMICALLIFQTPVPPQALAVMSPWLDYLETPQEELYARLAEQDHRRVIKTHTPLDGLPIDPRAKYIVIGRHPVDRAASLYNQLANIDYRRLSEFIDEAHRIGGKRRGRLAEPPPLPPIREWLENWCAPSHVGDMGSVPDDLVETIHHLHQAWTQRAQPYIWLTHFDDLRNDLSAEMARLAAWLDITVEPAVWTTLVKAATFEEMKSQAARVAPTHVLKSPEAFFHRGQSGTGWDVLSAEGHAAYLARVERMAPPDFLAWLHR